MLNAQVYLTVFSWRFFTNSRCIEEIRAIFAGTIVVNKLHIQQCFRSADANNPIYRLINDGRVVTINIWLYFLHE